MYNLQMARNEWLFFMIFFVVNKKKKKKKKIHFVFGRIPN
jgi:hypothetical protein